MLIYPGTTGRVLLAVAGGAGVESEGQGRTAGAEAAAGPEQQTLSRGRAETVQETHWHGMK